MINLMKYLFQCTIVSVNFNNLYLYKVINKYFEQNITISSYFLNSLKFVKYFIKQF